MHHCNNVPHTFYWHNSPNGMAHKARTKVKKSALKKRHADKLFCINVKSEEKRELISFVVVAGPFLEIESSVQQIYKRTFFPYEKL